MKILCEFRKRSLRGYENGPSRTGSCCILILTNLCHELSIPVGMVLPVIHHGRVVVPVGGLRHRREGVKRRVRLPAVLGDKAAPRVVYSQCAIVYVVVVANIAVAAGGMQERRREKSAV